jgi:hypothetical protein
VRIEDREADVEETESSSRGRSSREQQAVADKPEAV